MNQQRACLQMCRAVFLQRHISPLLRRLGGHVFLCHCRNITQTGRCFSRWKAAIKINHDSSAENSKQKLWEIFSAFVVANGASVNNAASKTGCHRVWDSEEQQLPRLPAHVRAAPKRWQRLREPSAFAEDLCRGGERTSALAGGAGGRRGAGRDASLASCAGMFSGHPHTGAQSPGLGWGPPLSKGLGVTFISVPSSPAATQIKEVPRSRWLPRRAPVESVRFQGGRVISQHADPSVKIQRRD